MDAKQELLRHTLATIAYRGGKAVRGAPASFASFKANETARTPAQIVAHMGDLFEWALSILQGTQRWKDSTPLPWDAEVARFFETLAQLDAHLASDDALGCPAEQIFQGPIADALTHVGQLAMLRRMAGAPVRAENYFKAAITIGRVGAEQALPRREFD
jgi:GAF domain-containing protein